MRIGLIFIIAIVIAISSYMFFYKKSSDALNPFGVSILIYMVMYGLSTLNLSVYQHEMLIRTHIMALIPMISTFFIGFYYSESYKKSIKKDRLPVVTSNYRFFMWIIVITSLFSVIYLLMSRGVSLGIDFSQVGVLNARKGEISGQIFEGAGIIGKFAQIFPYCIVFVAYDFIYNDDKSLLLMLIEIGYGIICAVYALLVLASRGTLLLPLLAILYMLNKKYHFSAKMIGILLLIIVAAFSIYMEYRVVKESAVFSGTVVSNRIFNSIYNYFALAFNNFDMLVRDGSPLTIVEYSLISFSKMIGIYSSDHIINHKTLIFNEELFIYGFYHDLGFWGILIWPILIYIFIGRIYVLSRDKKPELILLLAMYGKALFVLPFGNYFFGSISAEIQYYACILLLFAGYKISHLPLFTFKIKRLKKLRVRL